MAFTESSWFFVGGDAHIAPPSTGAFSYVARADVGIGPYIFDVEKKVQTFPCQSLRLFASQKATSLYTREALVRCTSWGFPMHKGAFGTAHSK